MDFTARLLLLSAVFEVVYLLALYLFVTPRRRVTDEYSPYESEWEQF